MRGSEGKLPTFEMEQSIFVLKSSRIRVVSKISLWKNPITLVNKSTDTERKSWAHFFLNDSTWDRGELRPGDFENVACPGKLCRENNYANDCVFTIASALHQCFCQKRFFTEIPQIPNEKRLNTSLVNFELKLKPLYIFFSLSL